MNKRSFLWLVLILVFLDAGLVIHNRLEINTRPEVGVKTTVVTRRVVEVVIPAVGIVEPLQTAEIRSPWSARVRSYLVNSGDWVEKGEPVVLLDENSLRESLYQLRQRCREARARWDELEKDASRINFLVKSGLMSSEAGAEYQARREKARREFESACQTFNQVYKGLLGEDPPPNAWEKEMGNLDLKEVATIRTPLSGVVSLPENLSGMRVETGQLLLNVLNLDQVAVKTRPFYTEEKVAVGQPVVVTTQEEDGLSFPGTVKSVHERKEGERKAVTAVIEVDNLARRLYPGMLVKAGITVYRTNNALTVPKQAVVRRQTPLGLTQSGVFVVRGGRAYLVPVEVGRYYNGGQVLIEGGLSEGSYVIIGTTGGNYPLHKLVDGMRVRIIEGADKAGEDTVFDKKDELSQVRRGRGAPCRRG